MAIKTRTDINPSIDEMSAQELRSLIDYAESKLQSKMDEAKQSLIEEMTEKARELGLSFGELFPNPSSEVKQGKKRGSVPVKYKDSATSQTWTGRGRTPAWLKDYEAQGRNREEFRV